MNNPKNNKAPKIELLLDLLIDLNEKVKSDESLTYLNKEKCDNIFNQFKMLDKNIFNHRNTSLNSADRLERIVYNMTQIANLNFSEKAEINNNENHLDYIGFSMNLMQDRLNERINKLKLIQKAFDSFNNLILLTDNENEIVYSNSTLNTQFELNQDEILGIKIVDFFDLPKIKNNYSLDFIDCISNNFTKSKNSNFVLKISKRTFGTIREYGHCYIIETMDSLLYGKCPRKNDELKIVLDFVCEGLKISKEETLNSIHQAFKEKLNLTSTDVKVYNQIIKLLNETTV